VKGNDRFGRFLTIDRGAALRQNRSLKKFPKKLPVAIQKSLAWQH